MKYCYNDYEAEPKIPSQNKLLASLQKMGYDNGMNFRLTVAGAVPVTALLFCIKDAYEEVRECLYDLNPVKKDPVQLRFDELPSDVRNVFNNPLPIYYKTYGPATHSSFASSGFQEAFHCDIYTPSPNVFLEGTAFPEGIFIRPDLNSVLKPDLSMEPVPLHRISKGMFKFLEFCYALSERIESEVRSITGKASKVDIASFSKFNQACGMRNGLVHRHGIPDIDFSISTGNLTISGQNLSDFLTQSNKEVYEWVEHVYTFLLTYIEKDGVSSTLD